MNVGDLIQTKLNGFPSVCYKVEGTAIVVAEGPGWTFHEEDHANPVRGAVIQVHDAGVISEPMRSEYFDWGGEVDHYKVITPAPYQIGSVVETRSVVSGFNEDGTPIFSDVTVTDHQPPEPPVQAGFKAIWDHCQLVDVLSIDGGHARCMRSDGQIYDVVDINLQGLGVPNNLGDPK